MNLILTRPNVEEAIELWLNEKGLSLDSKVMKFKHKNNNIKESIEEVIVSVDAKKILPHLYTSYLLP